MKMKTFTTYSKTQFLFRVVTLISAVFSLYAFSPAIASGQNLITIFDLSGISSDDLPKEWTQILPRKQMAYTNYLVKQDSDGAFLHMNSGGTGSLIERDLGQIELNDSAVMEWTWKVLQLPDVEWEQDKNQDDFAIRIELVYDLRGSPYNPLNMVRKGLIQTIFKGYPPEIIMSYTWSRRVPAEKPYVNPAEKRMVIFPVESGPSMSGLWIDESRSIMEDLKPFIKTNRLVLKKVRIRCDSDDSLSKAESALRSIVFKNNK